MPIQFKRDVHRNDRTQKKCVSVEPRTFTIERLFQRHRLIDALIKEDIISGLKPKQKEFLLSITQIIPIIEMTAKDYSFEPVGAVDPSAPIVEAVPSNGPESYNNEEAEHPSDTAIMVGCGLLGWVVA